MKTDARVRYTKAAIREAFLEALRTKTVREMTVKEICDTAQINRATFYKYYQDCYDLMEKISQEMLQEYQCSMEKMEIFDVQEMTDAIFDWMEEHSDLCDLLIFQHKENSVLRNMMTIAYTHSMESWKQKLHYDDPAEIEMLFTCLSSGLVQVILGGYEKYSRRKLTAFIVKTVQNALKPYME